MKTTLRTGILALCATCLTPLAALADDDDFGISDTPAPKAVPVYYNYIEFGAGYSSENDIRFDRYKGLNGIGGFGVGSYKLLMRGDNKDNETWFVRGTGERLGSDSRLVTLEGGSQGAYKLNFEYAGLPYNNFEGKSPFQGIGSDRLVLPGGWTRAASAMTLNQASLSTLKTDSIGTHRDRFRSGLTWNVDPQLTLRMSAQHEDKRGTKPLGIDVNSTTAAMVVPEPVNHRHDRAETELSYAGKRFQWKVGYQLSVFNNDTPSFMVDNPFTTAANNNIERMSLAPSNVAHSVNADGGFQLNDYTRLVANFSQSLYTQDQTFLPYSANGAQTVTIPMPRSSLDGKIANTVVNFEVNSRPISVVDVKARYRYTLRNNMTPRSLYTYIATDNENQAPATTGRSRFNVPYTYEENLAGIDVGYNLTSRTKITVGYEFREFMRNYSERARNIDNTGKIALRTQFTDDLTGNFKYSKMVRDGSEYDPRGSLIWTNTAAHLATNGYDNNKLLRKYFEADVYRDNATAAFTYAASDALTLGLGGGLTMDNYPKSQLGLTDATTYTGTLDASYELREGVSLNSFYTFESRSTQQAGNQTLALGNWWWVDTSDDSHTLGAGVKWKAFERTTLSADYSFVWSQMAIASRSYQSSENYFPSITTRNHILAGRALYDLTDQATLGFGYAYERQRTKDWQLDLSAINSTGVMYMGPTSPNYDAHLVTLTTGYKF